MLFNRKRKETDFEKSNPELIKKLSDSYSRVRHGCSDEVLEEYNTLVKIFNDGVKKEVKATLRREDLNSPWYANNP